MNIYIVGEGDYGFLRMLEMKNKVHYISLIIKRSSVFSDLYLMTFGWMCFGTGIVGTQPAFSSGVFILKPIFYCKIVNIFHGWPTAGWSQQLTAVAG